MHRKESVVGSSGDGNDDDQNDSHDASNDDDCSLSSSSRLPLSLSLFTLKKGSNYSQKKKTDIH